MKTVATPIYRKAIRALVKGAWRAFLVFALALPGAAFCGETEMGFEGDVLVLSTDGTALDPNLKVKGFSVFGATQAVYVGAEIGPGNVVVNGVLAVSSGAYFVGNSTFTGAAKIFINDGSAGQLLRKNSAGHLEWSDASAIGDNLGNHVATTTLQMGAYGVNTSSHVSAAAYQINGSTVLSLLAGSESLGVGIDAGRVNSGDSNVFVGYNSGYSNTTGVYNVFAGYKSGYLNTTGNYNSFLGYFAGYANSVGSANSFFGYRAGNINSTGENNSLFGVESGKWNQTGSANSLLGYRAGGFGTGAANSFSSSTIVGYQAGYNLTAGSADNIMLGWQAGYAVTTGTGNIVIGYNKDTSGPGASNELNIGGLLYGNMGAASRTLGVGQTTQLAALDVKSTGTAVNQMAQLWRDGGGVIKSSMSATGVMMAAKFVGNGSGLTNLPAGPGDSLGTHIATMTITANYGITSSTAINAAYYRINGSTVLAILPGGFSLAVGPGAGVVNSGTENIFIGASAGASNTSGRYNTFVGASAGGSNTTGWYNSFLGDQAGAFNNGDINSFVGYYAGMWNTTGRDNSIVGGFAGYANKTGSANVIFGKEAGYGVSNNSFSSSTLLGYRAGYGLTTGSDNILLGWQAGDSLTTGTGNIIIGYDKDIPAPGANNELNIGGVLFGNLGAASKTIGVGQQTQLAALDVKSTGTAANVYAQIWRNGSGVEVASMTSTGVLYATIPPGAVAGDNLGNHVATTTLQMGAYGVNTSSHVSAAAYQINGSTVLSIIGGAGNIAVGISAGVANTSGWDNSFFGSYAGNRNTSGRSNTFIGAGAGAYTTTGGANSFLGHDAGYFTQTGSANVLVGKEAGHGVNSNSFSSATLAGYRAGYALSTGSDNILLGFQAGDSVTTGARNIVIGYDQDASVSTASNELNIGGVLYGDLSAKTIGISTRVPQAALDIVSTGTAVNQMAQLWRDGGGVIKSSMSATGVMMAARFVGDGSGLTNLTGGGDSLGTHIATQTLQMGAYGINTSSAITAASYQIDGSTVLALPGIESLSVGINAGRLNTGKYNVFVGSAAGGSVTDGWHNTLVGHQAGYNVAGARYNTFVGSYSGYNANGWNNAVLGYHAGENTSGSYNAFMGSYAGQSNTTGNYNAVYGALAATENTTGGNNSIVGTFAGRWNLVGAANAMLGNEAGGYNEGSNPGGVTFSSSTLVGYQAGSKILTGSDNIFLGFRAGANATTGARNLVIGYDQGVSAAGVSNELNIGGVLYGKLDAKTIGISTRVPQAALDIVSTGTASNIMAQIWRDGSGVIVGSMSATGSLKANRFVGDGSGLTNLPPGGSAGDSLGTHIATQTLNMAGFPIVNISSLAMLGDGLRISTSVGADASGILITREGSLQTQGVGNWNFLPDPRGMGAVDLQTVRYNSGQVASGALSTVGGGDGNTASGNFSVVPGGSQNIASGVVSSVSGGSGNTAAGGTAVVGGGNGNVASGDNSVVSGGYVNTAGDYGSVVSGGNENMSSGYASVVSGGQLNIASGGESVVSGGTLNTAQGDYSTISGGYINKALGSRSVVPGGRSNTAAADYSFAAGYKSSSTAMGAFTWSDSQGVETRNNIVDRTVFKNRGGFLVTGSTNPVMGGALDRGMLVTANGLVGISTGVPYAALDVVGTGTVQTQFTQIWRASDGVIKASMSATGVMMATRFVGDGSGLTGISGGSSGPAIDVSTINAPATTPYGGVNITTNTFVQGNLSVGTTSAAAFDLEIANAAAFFSEYNNGNSGTAKTLNWLNGNKQVLTLTGNVTLTFSAPAGKAASFLLRLVQDATGGRTVSWPATVKWRGGVPGRLSTAANAVDIVSLYYSGTNYYACASTGYQ